MDDKASKSGIGLGGLALGAVAGVIAGILLAPKTGKETRDDLLETLNKIKDDIALKLGDVKDLTEQTYRSAVDGVVQMYQDARKLSDDQASEIKTDLAHGYEEIKQAARKSKTSDQVV